jgi:hypothetical protein
MVVKLKKDLEEYAQNYLDKENSLIEEIIDLKKSLVKYTKKRCFGFTSYNYICEER